VRARLSVHDLTSEDLDTVEVVLAEVMNNIAEHAFAWRQDGELVLYLKMASEGLMCSITDEGRAMPEDALLTEAPSLTAAKEEEPSEGGYGWLIIRQLARDVTYLRKDGVNQLSFRLMVGPPDDSRTGLD
jgi:serine/threonine-protein kinase RsbW